MKYQMTPVLTRTEKRHVSELEKVAREIDEREARREQLIDKLLDLGLPARLIARSAGLGHNAISRRRSKRPRTNNKK